MGSNTSENFLVLFTACYIQFHSSVITVWRGLHVSKSSHKTSTYLKKRHGRGTSVNKEKGKRGEKLDENGSIGLNLVTDKGDKELEGFFS